MLRQRFRRSLAIAVAAFFGVGLLVGAATSASAAAPSPAAASAAVLMQTFDSDNGRIGGGWWESATALSAILTYEQATGDKQYEYAMTQAYAKNGSFTNQYIDDTGWWALAWMQAYDVTGNANYLNIAKTNVNYMHTFWDTKCGGGGVYWKNDRKYKATISNELFLAASAGLHNRIPGDSQYLGWANDEWNWLKNGSGLLLSSNQLRDGVTVSDCSYSNVELTYNQGTILYGLVELNRATGDGSLLTTAKNIASATIANKSRNGVLTEGCEPGCSHDLSGMKGIFMRYLRILATAAKTTQYDGFMTSTANSILAYDTNGAGQQGVAYTGPFANWSYLTQTSALEALVAAGTRISVPLPTGSGVLKGQESGRCVDVPGGNQANGTAPALWDCNNGANQTWTSTSSKQLTVFGGKCLDAVGHGTANGTKVDIWDCNGGLNQQWTLTADGTVVGVESGKCLDATGHGTANGTLLQIWTCNGGANQKWSRI
jgi:rhamnogalacturonyl hydrolase YesR